MASRRAGMNKAPFSICECIKMEEFLMRELVRAPNYAGVSVRR